MFARKKAGFALSVLGMLVMGEALPAAERFDYDPLGRLIRRVDADNRATDYSYDAAGNLVEVTNANTAQAPTITQTQLGDFRRNEIAQVTVTGINLMGVNVRGSDSGLIISNILQSRTSMSFQMAVASSLSLGAHQLLFSNSAGTVPVGLNVVAGRLFVFEPSYITIPPDGLARKFGVRMSEPSPLPQTFNLSTQPSAIARTQSDQITFPAGTTFAEFGLVGLVQGSTAIAISGNYLAAPIEGLVSVQAGAANRLTLSQSVGLTKGLPWSASPNSLAVSGAIGIAKGTPWSSSPYNHAVTGSVGIAKGTPWSSAPASLAVSGSVGISKGTPWSSSPGNLVMSGAVGITKAQ